MILTFRSPSLGFWIPSTGTNPWLLGQLGFSETAHSEPLAENKVCPGGGRRADFDQDRGVTLKQ